MRLYLTENNPYFLLSLVSFFNLSTLSHRCHIGLIKSVMFWYTEIFETLNKRFKCWHQAILFHRPKFSIGFYSLHNFKTEQSSTAVNNTGCLICTVISLFSCSESAYKCTEVDSQEKLRWYSPVFRNWEPKEKKIFWWVF